MTDLVFTFRDQITGQFADVIAPNEAAARFKLGGDWIDAERAARWGEPSGDLEAIIRQAQDDQRASFEALQAANPMGEGRFTTPEALKRFNDLRTAHENIRARVGKLGELSVFWPGIGQSAPRHPDPTRGEEIYERRNQGALRAVSGPLQGLCPTLSRHGASLR